MRAWRPHAAILFWCLLTPPTLFAHSSTVVDTGLPSGPKYVHAQVGPQQFIAQQFILPVSSEIVEVAVYVAARRAEGAESQLRVQIVRSIGIQATYRDVLADLSFPVKPGLQPRLVTVKTHLPLEAGRYYLVYSSRGRNTAGIRLIGNAPIPLGPARAASGERREINALFPPASNFTRPPDVDGFAVTMKVRIDRPKIARPLSPPVIAEPSSILLWIVVSMGGTAALCIYRFRRQAAVKGLPPG